MTDATEDQALDYIMKKEVPALRLFAKMQADGKPTGLDKSNWHDAITKRAEIRYEGTELSEAQKYTRTIEKDPLGQSLYQAYKSAPYPEAKEAPVETREARIKKQSDLDGENHARLHSLAVDMQRAKPGLSYERAFATVYGDPKNKKIADGAKAEHLNRAIRSAWGGDATQQGDVAYNQQNNPVGHASGKGVKLCVDHIKPRRKYWELRLLPKTCRFCGMAVTLEKARGTRRIGDR